MASRRQIRQRSGPSVWRLDPSGETGHREVLLLCDPSYSSAPCAGSGHANASAGKRLRSNRLSLVIPAPLPVSESCVRRAVNRPMSAHSPVWLYGTLQMRIVMFFANSDHTHLDHNSAISWARSEAAYHGSNDPWPRSLTPLSSSQPAAAPRCTQRDGRLKANMNRLALAEEKRAGE